MTILAFSATAGVLVEFYDFFIFGYAAASVFPSVFSPNLSPTLGLVFSYLAFGAGFPARLLGAFIFGHFGDRVGRRWSFLINILIVGAATCLTGLLPGYATLGLAAPIILVCLRTIQGIGLGGEFGGASSLLAEFGSRRRHPAFWMSLANLGIPGGAMLASAVLLMLSGNFATVGLADCDAAFRRYPHSGAAGTLQTHRFSAFRAAQAAGPAGKIAKLRRCAGLRPSHRASRLSSRPSSRWTATSAGPTSSPSCTLPASRYRRRQLSSFSAGSGILAAWRSAAPPPILSAKKRRSCRHCGDHAAFGSLCPGHLD